MKTLAAAAAFVVLCASAGQCTGSVQAESPAARAQVSGSRERMNVSADHTNVLSLLKLVCDQAGADFAPAAGVAGEVTLSLHDSPFAAVINAICQQTFLRAQVKPGSPALVVEPDDGAIRKAFERITTLNSALHQNLRALGLEVPSVEQLAGSESGSFRPRALSVGHAAPGSVGLNGPAASPAGASGPLGPPGKIESGASSAGGAPFNARSGGLGGFGGLGGTARPPRYIDAGTYRQYVAQNGYVEFHAPKSQPVPVAVALQSLASQANVRLLLHPSIPNGPAFRISGDISARPLPEALNLLAPYARIEWRWAGQAIFVSPSPDFEVAFGSGATTKYPAPRTTGVPPTKPEGSTDGR